MENFIHIWFSLFGVELNEDNHRNCKQTGVKREERERRHLGKKELKHDGIVNYIWSRGEGRVRASGCHGGVSKGLCEHLRAEKYMRAVRLFLRARAVIKCVLRAASTSSIFWAESRSLSIEKKRFALASFPVVLGDFGCDVTCQACRENSPRTPGK